MKAGSVSSCAPNKRQDFWCQYSRRQVYRPWSGEILELDHEIDLDRALIALKSAILFSVGLIGARILAVIDGNIETVISQVTARR